MGDTGYNWGAWQFAKDSAGGDWNGDDTALIADNDTEISNASISLDGIAACEVGIELTEDNTGAIDGVVTVYVLGYGGTGWEKLGPVPWSFTVTPGTNYTLYKRFGVDPGSYGEFKIAMFNESGQTLETHVKYRTATIPVATA